MPARDLKAIFEMSCTGANDGGYGGIGGQDMTPAPNSEFRTLVDSKTFEQGTFLVRGKVD